MEKRTTTKAAAAPQQEQGQASRRKRQQSLGPLDQLPVGGDVGNPLNGVTNTLGSVANNAVDEHQGGDGRKNDALRLRLDLNLDIEIQLKARIHGDLELALLYVTLPSPGKNSHPTSVLGRRTFLSVQSPATKEREGLG
ncbi:hypothetical protein NW754_007761 [Fusarium falciforme]|nr:hypothetical protein NW754_007761 [Fusarium falciforme]